MGRSGCNSARCNRRNRRARNGPCQRTRIHTVATGVIDEQPGAITLGKCGRLGRGAQALPTAPTAAVIARPGQARHFAMHTQGLFPVNRVDQRTRRLPRMSALPPIATTSQRLLSSAALLLTAVDKLTTCQPVKCVKLIFDQAQLPAPRAAPHTAFVRRKDPRPTFAAAGQVHQAG
jgi:hypothetical protein